MDKSNYRHHLDTHHDTYKIDSTYWVLTEKQWDFRPCYHTPHNRSGGGQRQGASQCCMALLEDTALQTV